MKARGLQALALTIVASCTGNGPIYPVGDALDDWVRMPAAVVPDNDQPPVISDPIVAFHLGRRDRLSALRAGDHWATGNTILFGFDIRADRAALGTDVVDISRFYRLGTPSVRVMSVQLDAKRGVTVMGRSCVKPSQLGDWHRVEMRMRLRDDDHGYLEVFCDRNPVWARTGIRTTFSPVCRLSEGCTDRVVWPLNYEWQFGLMSERGVSTPVTVQMRRLHHRLLLYIPNRAGNL